MLASSSFALIIRQYLEQLKQFGLSIAIFDAEIARLMADFDTKLDTITGIGKTLVAVIFSEIGGDIRKFSSVPKLVAYAGLYPKSRQSDESKFDEHMSKHGSPYLRRAVWLAATVAAFNDPAISVFYQKSNGRRTEKFFSQTANISRAIIMPQLTGCPPTTKKAKFVNW